MADALENAASAFDDAMGVSRPSPKKEEESEAAEEIFSNSQEPEGDTPAGGDEDEEVVEEEELDPEAEEGDEDDDEDEEEGDDELDNTEFEVMVEGEPTKVKLREALDGYIRTATFHQRLNKLNAFGKELEGAANKLVADRRRTDEILEEAQTLLETILPPEPDWDKLYADNPQNARTLQKQYDGLKAKISEVKERRTNAQKEAAEKALKEQQDFAASEFPKFAAKAGWKDQKQAKNDIDSMRRTALAVGFTEKEVASVYDSRMLTVLLKAAKYDRIMASKPRPVVRKGKPLKPGAGNDQGRTAQRGVRRAQKQLGRTGSVEDAANVFSRIIE